MMKLLFILSILPALLGGEYNAVTLSEAEQDSILKVQSDKGQGDKVPSDKVPSTRYRLEKTNAEKIFRRSELAEWYVYDTLRHTRKQLGGGKVRDAVMSPNGRYVAFAKGNNLYIHKADYGTEVAVTKDAHPDLINGIADWLYEEEFGVTALFAWSPDSKQLAFVRLDEREVPNFTYEKYIGAQYPKLDSIRYPKSGCANAKASVCVYNLDTKAIQTMQVNKENADVYFPRLHWTSEENLLVLRVDRDQTQMVVLACNAKSTVSHPLYKEASDKYFVDYELFDQWQWLSDGRFVVLSEKDGWRRAYLHNAQGMEQKALTPEGTDVTALYAVNEKTQTLFYQAATTPATRDIYAVHLKKEGVIRLTEGEGMHSARFAKDGNYAILCFQSFTTPNTYTLYEVKGEKLKGKGLLQDNDSLAEAWKANNLPEPELMQIPNKNGQLLEAMLLRPSAVSLQPAALVVMHYSGPASQRVLNRWRKKFEYALVEAGYAVLIVDPRGTDCKGRAWRNETYMSLGQKEAEDLIAAAQWAGNRPDIDAKRMALLGWSYGGYETLYTMCMPNHPFKAGVAIAPVTDWRLYDTGYTERFMRRPQVNSRGYDKASLMPRAKDMTGDVLIIHGTGDDNVHAQHAYLFIDALVQADKQFEMQLYTDDNHHLRKGNNAKHMHERILRFLERTLKR